MNAFVNCLMLVWIMSVEMRCLRLISNPHPRVACYGQSSNGGLIRVSAWSRLLQSALCHGQSRYCRRFSLTICTLNVINTLDRPIVVVKSPWGPGDGRVQSESGLTSAYFLWLSLVTMVQHSCTKEMHQAEKSSCHWTSVKEGKADTLFSLQFHQHGISPTEVN